MQNASSKVSREILRMPAKWAIYGGFAFGGTAFTVLTSQDPSQWQFYLFIVMPLCFLVGAVIGYLLRVAFVRN